MILTGLFFMAGEKGRLEAHIPGSLSLSLIYIFFLCRRTLTKKHPSHATFAEKRKKNIKEKEFHEKEDIH